MARAEPLNKSTAVRTSLSFQKLTSGPIARATARTTGVLVARLLVQAGILLVLARLLGPASFGAFASLFALATFLGAFANFGTHLTLARDLARHPEQRGTVLPVVLGTTALCGTAMLAIYLLISIGLLHALSVGLVVLVCIGVAELLMQPLLMISSMERLAADEVARAHLTRILPLPLQFAAAALLWLVGSDDPLSMYAIAHLGAALIALALSLAVLVRPWPGPRQWRLLDRKGWKENGGFALLALTASGPSELDKTLAARLLPLEVAGLYAAASRIAGALLVPIASLTTSAMPRLFRESVYGLPELRFLRLIFASSLAYGLAAASALWLLSPAIDLLFGKSFAGLSLTIRWFSLVLPGICLRFAAANVLMSIGRPWIRVSVEGAGVLLLVSSATAFVSGGVTQGMVIVVACVETAMATVAWGWIWTRYLGNARPAVDV